MMMSKLLELNHKITQMKIAGLFGWLAGWLHIVSYKHKVLEQCGVAASKGNQILGLIRRNITYKEKELIMYVFKAIVRPHLEYCIEARRPHRKKDVDTLERIQRRATKMIPELRDLSYEERLKECGLTTLETSRLRGDEIEVFKILNGYENIDTTFLSAINSQVLAKLHLWSERAEVREVLNKAKQRKAILGVSGEKLFGVSDLLLIALCIST